MLNKIYADAMKSQAALIVDPSTQAKSGGYVTMGYGQVEPNHLSAQRTAQIYAQLPAKADINILENGQFVKYNYKDGVVDFAGAGEWMLVFNEIKLYRENQSDCEFAMKKDDYVARIYSPVAEDVNFAAQSRYYGGFDSEGNAIEKVTAPADIYELHATEDPFHIASQTSPKEMPAGSTMVPRVFKTNVGDIFTTNMIKETTLALGDLLTPGADGILAKAGAASANMQWQVVKVYTLPDHQPAVKLMRIA